MLNQCWTLPKINWYSKHPFSFLIHKNSSWLKLLSLIRTGLFMSLQPWTVSLNIQRRKPVLYSHSLSDSTVRSEHITPGLCNLVIHFSHTAWSECARQRSHCYLWKSQDIFYSVKMCNVCPFKDSLVFFFLLTYSLIYCVAVSIWVYITYTMKVLVTTVLKYPNPERSAIILKSHLSHNLYDIQHLQGTHEASH